MQSVDAVLRQAAADLDAIGARWAVIGGLAVAFRAEPRFTKDVFMPVASTGHLIALKVLAGRHQDLTDLGYRCVESERATSADDH